MSREPLPFVVMKAAALAQAAQFDNLERAYLEYCEARRDAANTPAARDFWHRLAGSVRKAATL